MALLICSEDEVFGIEKTENMRLVRIGLINQKLLPPKSVPCCWEWALGHEVCSEGPTHM